MYKAVIFDFNGTLFFDNDKHVKAWSDISMLLRGRPITEEELHSQINGKCNEQIIRSYRPEFTEEENKKYSLLKEEYYRNYCSEDTKNFHLVQGAEQFFDSLKEQNIPFTIASASIWQNMNFFIQSFHLDHWISKDWLVYDDGTYSGKTEMFQEAARRMQVDMQDTLIIEDSVTGIQHAYEAGCRNIWVMDSSGNASYLKTLPGVTKVISNFL